MYCLYCPVSPSELTDDEVLDGTTLEYEDEYEEEGGQEYEEEEGEEEEEEQAQAPQLLQLPPPRSPLQPVRPQPYAQAPAQAQPPAQTQVPLPYPWQQASQRLGGQAYVPPAASGAAPKGVAAAAAEVDKDDGPDALRRYTPGASTTATANSSSLSSNGTNGVANGNGSTSTSGSSGSASTGSAVTPTGTGPEYFTGGAQGQGGGGGLHKGQWFLQQVHPTWTATVLLSPVDGRWWLCCGPLPSRLL